MASTWTDEQDKKLEAECAKAFNAGKCSLPTDEYWVYIAGKVGDGKTGKDCKNRCEELSKPRKEGLTSIWTEEEARKFNSVFFQECSSAKYTIGSNQFWEYIAKRVGGGKTWKDCREKHLKDMEDARKDEMPKNDK